MKKKRFIPFSFWPDNWGLAGQLREEAKAHYYYTGEELERRLVEIRTKPGPERELQNLEIDREYGRIEKRFYQERKAKLTKEGVDLDLALNEIAFEHGDIDHNEFEKRQATLKDEPWVGVISDEFDPNQGTNGFAIELSWNDQFIEFLRLNGYGGTSDVDIVEKWFGDVTREAQLPPDDIMDVSLNLGTRMTNRIDRGGGKADYS